MRTNKGNQKAIYTKRQIAEALLVLLRERDYNGVTISALCGKAGCSRPSFYRNFNSIDDVFAFYIKDRIDNYKANLDIPAGSRSVSGDTVDMAILDLWIKERDFVALIVRRGLLNDFILTVCHYISEPMLGDAAVPSQECASSGPVKGKPASDEDRAMAAQYRSAMQAYYTGAVLYAWAARGLIDEPDEVKHVLSSIRKESGF